MPDTHQIAVMVTLISSGVALITDLRSGKIPNLVTYPTALIGIGLSLINQLTGRTPDIGTCLIGLTGGLALYGLLMLVGSLGGGDVKLMAAIGTLMGFPFIIQSSVMIVIFGAIIAILLLTVRRQFISSINRLAGVVTGSISVTSLANVHSVDSRTMPFAPAIFLGVLWTILQR
jgi:prepilin peptidase CpaA